MTPTIPQDEQSRLWNGSAGEAWSALQSPLDTLFRGIEHHLAQAVAQGADLQILDVGCGTGATALAAAARLTGHGHCLGVDLSAAMIERARQRAAQTRLPVSFQVVDAQQLSGRARAFHRIQSRFGVMFFEDPVAGFGSLRARVRDGGELHVVTWRGRAENPFMTLANRVAAPLVPTLPTARPDAPGQFALADATRIRAVLAASGWRDRVLEPLDLPCAMPLSALESYVTRMGPLGQVWDSLDVRLQQRLRTELLDAFQDFVVGDRVCFVAACWDIRARR